MTELSDTDEIVVRPMLELSILADRKNRTVIVLHVAHVDGDSFLPDDRARLDRVRCAHRSIRARCWDDWPRLVWETSTLSRTQNSFGPCGCRRNLVVARSVILRGCNPAAGRFRPKTRAGETADIGRPWLTGCRNTGLASARKNGTEEQLSGRRTSMNRPRKPNGLDAPGLIYRPRAHHWVLCWGARPDIVRRGYPIETAGCGHIPKAQLHRSRQRMSGSQLLQNANGSRTRCSYGAMEVFRPSPPLCWTVPPGVTFLFNCISAIPTVHSKASASTPSGSTNSHVYTSESGRTGTTRCAHLP